MSIMLTLLPLKTPQAFDGDGVVYPLSTLDVQPDDRIVGQIVDLSLYLTNSQQNTTIVPHVTTHPIPDRARLYWRYDSSMRGHQKDPHNRRIRWTHTANLKMVRIPDDAHPFNRAIMAYLGQLPDDIPVIIWPSP